MKDYFANERMFTYFYIQFSKVQICLSNFFCMGNILLPKKLIFLFPDYYVRQSAK